MPEERAELFLLRTLKEPMKQSRDKKTCSFSSTNLCPA